MRKLTAGNAAVPVPESIGRSEEHTSELQSLRHIVCRLLLEKKKLFGVWQFDCSTFSRQDCFPHRARTCGHVCRNFRNFYFFFNDTATTEISTLSPHDALPI